MLKYRAWGCGETVFFLWGDQEDRGWGSLSSEEICGAKNLEVTLCRPHGTQPRVTGMPGREGTAELGKGNWWEAAEVETKAKAGAECTSGGAKDATLLPGF